MNTKRCVVCDKRKPLDDYYAGMGKLRKDGTRGIQHRLQCTPCYLTIQRAQEERCRPSAMEQLFLSELSPTEVRI